MVSKVTKAKLQVESLKDGGECYKSFCSKYDTQSKNFTCGKNGQQVFTLLNTGVNCEGNFNRLLSNICKYIDQCLQSLKSPPISCFKFFYFRFWLKKKADLLHHCEADIKTLVAHFSYLLPEEKTVSSVVDQRLDLMLLISQPTQRAP